MGSAASYVYTNLGLVELERWTKLNKAYQACRKRLADGATFEQEVALDAFNRNEQMAQQARHVVATRSSNDSCSHICSRHEAAQA